MATAYLRAESAPVILPHNFAQAAAVMAQFDRAAIASAIEVMVNLLDVLDGDADREPEPVELNGDELDSTGAEDEICPGLRGDFSGPGCAIADAGGGNVEDEGESEQLRDDVPTLPVRTSDGKHIGYSNLLTSFVGWGGRVRSADTGRYRMPADRVGDFGVPV